jgi:hypothetical protein
MNRLTTEDFIEKAKSIHNDKYDYSKSVFLTTRSKIKITCKYHGDFNQKVSNHLNGNGCKKCHFDNRKQNFIENAKSVHGDKYDYSLVKYEHNESKVKIICPSHGVFEQTAYHHINRKQGCKICKSSIGENIIKKYLDDKNIKYIKECRFDECKNIQPLPFDFYLPDYNICIEYDGIQHYKPLIFFGGDKGFNKLKINDTIKDNYCKTNNIKLIRIKYTDTNIGNTLLQNVDQSLDRAYRIGQTKDVICYFPLFDDTIDTIVYEVLDKKRDIINMAIDGVIDNKGVIEEVINRLDEKFKK